MILQVKIKKEKLDLPIFPQPDGRGKGIEHRTRSRLSLPPGAINKLGLVAGLKHKLNTLFDVDSSMRSTVRISRLPVINEPPGKTNAERTHK